MIALPASATPMASQVRPATRSPIQIHPRSPAMNGLRLWMISTFATEVRWSAMMKQVEPMAKQTAMPTPVAPMRANAPAPLARAPRVLYAIEGALLAVGAADPAAAVGPGADGVRAAGAPARVYRVELVRQPPPPAGARVLLEHPIDLAGGSDWLMR